jgi:hypothetical protein
MMKLTKTGIGLLTRLYRSVLHKCFLINAGIFFALAPSAADAAKLDIAAGEKVKTSEDFIDLSSNSVSAIINRGILIVDGSTFRNNTSTEGGGAVEGSGSSYTLIKNALFENNIAMGTMGQSGSIVNSSYLTVINSIFRGSKASHGGGVSEIYGNQVMTFIDSSFYDNRAAYGAALMLWGGVNIVSSSKDSIFYGNKTLGGVIEDIYFVSRNDYPNQILNLNANVDTKIVFSGLVHAGDIAQVNINKGGLMYAFINEDMTPITKTVTEMGGSYVFSNLLSVPHLNVYNNANIKFEAIEQEKTYNTSTPLYDNNTTYGSFALNSLTTDENGGHIDMRNSHIENNSAATLTLGSQLKIGLDIQHPTTGTTGTADKITYTSGSGSILIDAINEIGTRPTATGTYLYQVLNGSGVTLALTDAIKTAWNTDTTTSSPKVRDPIPATTAWTDKIYNRWTDTRVQGSLDVSGNNLVYSVINTQTAKSEIAGDTLALVTTATNNASRIFSTTDATAEYLLSTNLGAVNAVYKNLSINGTVSGNNRSTLNLGNYNGFVLDSSDDNLSLSSMKVSGGTDYSVNLANSGSNLNVANVIMDSTTAPITGAGNVEFTGDNEINTKVLNTGTTTVSSGTTDFNGEVAGFTVSAPATVSIAADDITAETTNNGTLELEGGNVTTKLMGAGRMKLMSGNVRLLSSTPPATTGSLSFGDSSDYVDSILTSSSAASTSDHALVTAGYLDNNYYMNYGDSMAKSFTKSANDNNFTTFNCVEEA